MLCSVEVAVVVVIQLNFTTNIHKHPCLFITICPYMESNKISLKQTDWLRVERKNDLWTKPQRMQENKSHQGAAHRVILVEARGDN